jgi:uncharacterized protein (TIGR03435 family)
MRTPAVLFGLALAVVTTHAQPAPPLQPALPAFDVVSVRPNQSGSPNSSTRVTGIRFTATNVSLISMLRAAFGLQEFQIDARQGWANVDRFDIVATLPGQASASDWPLMLRSLLRDRFKLRFHIEPRPAPVYVLSVAKNGHKLKPADPSKCSNPSGSCGFNGSPTQIDGNSVSTAQLATRLSRSIGVMVIDQTGVNGLFDMVVNWTVDDQFTGRGASASPTIFGAIQDQLGLRLESTRAPVDVLVVDSADKPAAD